MKNLYFNRYLKDFIEFGYLRNKIIFFSIALTYLSWCIFEYIWEPDIYLPILFLKIVPLFVIGIFYKFVPKEKVVFYTIFYSTLHTYYTIITLLALGLANHKIVYMTGLTLYVIILPLVIYCIPYIFYPSTITMIISTIFFKDYFMSESISLFHFITIISCMIIYTAITPHFIYSTTYQLFSLTKTLLKTNSSLEEKNEEVSSLLSVMGHDFANFISVISGAAMLLAKSDLQNKDKELVSIIEECAQGQKNLVLNIKDHLAVSSGKKTLILKETSLNEILSHAEFIFKEKLLDKNISIVKSLSEKDYKFLADKVSFSNIIFNNLISNAIKFSHPNSKINISAYSVKDVINLEIQDFGIGMSNELVSKVFSKTESTSRLGTSGEEGTGFGMPLVKTYIDAQNGTIDVKSEPESGTTYIISMKKC
ncbi:HAMP domain-containing histidine kinase [Bacteriovoracaceae bacterium]|nr:HAMP domain-containing histidine kinase [Bacteriovoracaceae bacterium]